MRNDFTFIAEILDRSGSMNMIRKATIDGHNEFLRGQKAAPGRAHFLLALFDHEYTIAHDGPLGYAAELDDSRFIPRGNTALLDAIGRTVTAVGQRLGTMPEEERPAKVVVVIMTDGEENASSEWTRERVFDLIKQQREKYAWEFIFLGANQDAILEGSKIGILPRNSAAYIGANTYAVYANVNHKVSQLRGMTMTMGDGASLDAFTDEERKDMEGAK